MTNERISYVCKKAAEIRKGTDITQHDAMVMANEQWNKGTNR